jgi:Aldos-2-ulose dehydratase, beta-propeller domain
MECEIYCYCNPDWSRFLLANKVKDPVGMDYADITGNGLPDVVICYELYGEKGTIVDPEPEDGKIDWLENPGNANNVTHRWERRYIGRTVGMHRLRVGHFIRIRHRQRLCIGQIRSNPAILGHCSGHLISAPRSTLRVPYSVCAAQGFTPLRTVSFMPY